MFVLIALMISDTYPIPIIPIHMNMSHVLLRCIWLSFDDLKVHATVQIHNTCTQLCANVKLGLPARQLSERCSTYIDVKVTPS